MQKLLTTGSSFLFFFVLFFSLPYCVRAEGCEKGMGLSSNNVRYLSGKGDTLWMVTEKDRTLYFNMIAGKEAILNPDIEKNWWLYSLSCKENLFDLIVGGRFAAASFDTAPNIIWLYDYSNSKIKETTFPWSYDSLRKFTAIDGAPVKDGFFWACLDGGLVKWKVADDTKTIFFPGKQNSFNLATIKPEDFPPLDTNKRVTNVEILKEDSLLIVTTPLRLWIFSIPDSHWIDSIEPAFTDEESGFIRFEYVFVNREDMSYPLYCIAAFNGGSEVEEVYSLCKYSRKNRKWGVVLKEAPISLSFGPNGIMYTVFNESRPGGTILRNIIRVYRDTLGDSGIIYNPTPLPEGDNIIRRMTYKHDIDLPQEINDVLYIPQSDTGGYLWIATSEGLFFSPLERPLLKGNDTSSFILIKRAPSVSSGLKNTYARPGILRSYDGSCKFIYNISAPKALVTIRVYDYNMELVKTIIENKERLSGTNGGPRGRSTVESEDFWDGTNRSGKPVTPGVYYYKITTSTGERAFGKIIIAR